MNPSRVRVFSRLCSALAALIVSFAPLVGSAQDRAPALWFQGTRLVLDHAIPIDGDLAVATRDTGLRRFLERLGATVSFDPRERYVVITAADRRTIAFTLGDPNFVAGGVRARAPFAPFADGNDAALPFFALARALYVEAVADGETVLQPRIGAVDVRPDREGALVTLHAAMPLVTQSVVSAADRTTIVFVGEGSALGPVHANGFDVTLTPGGTARVPTTTVVLAGKRLRARPVGVETPDAYGVAVDAAASPQPVAQSGAPPTPPPLGGASAFPPAGSATPLPAPVAPVVAGRASVTDLAIDAGGAGALNVVVHVSGASSYEWHRLLDNRWYLDLANTTMNGPGREERPGFGAVQSVRVRQTGSSDMPAVRIAFTLTGTPRVDVVPTADGVRISVVDQPAADLARAGSGRTGGVDVVASAVETSAPAVYAPTPAPSMPAAPLSSGNPRLIVIDPGHGGGDSGAQHNGLVEKQLTFDIAQRLRGLLVAAGWQVRLTRESDVDPVSPALLAQMRGDGKPNADDRAYLQTRCDVANATGARLFISIHINSAPVTSARGTTTYWYKPQDAALAQAIQRAVTGTAGTQDDGTRHENFYVVRHTTMPAVLVETAFITNPGDVALLRSPDFLQSVASGIAAGVKAYTGSPAANSVSKQ